MANCHRVADCHVRDGGSGIRSALPVLPVAREDKWPVASDQKLTLVENVIRRRFWATVGFRKYGEMMMPLNP